MENKVKLGLIALGLSTLGLSTAWDTGLEVHTPFQPKKDGTYWRYEQKIYNGISTETRSADFYNSDPNHPLPDCPETPSYEEEMSCITLNEERINKEAPVPDSNVPLLPLVARR